MSHLNKESMKAFNKENIKKAVLNICESSKSISTVPLEINTNGLNKVSLSMVAINRETAKRIEDSSLIVQGAELAVRFSIHDSQRGPNLSAEPLISDGEIAFIQLYFRYDRKKQQVLVLSNLEVADNYNGNDLQGYGIGSSFMPSSEFDIRVLMSSSVVKKHFPDAKKIIISMKDFAKGKSGKDRNQWTTDLAEKSDYEQSNGYLIKTVEL